MSNTDKDFFISYQQADKGWAEGLHGWLESSGYSIVMQATDFGPGSNFVLEMDKATKKAKRTIAVLSPDYLNSRFASPEWAEAFARDPTGKLSCLVPVRVRDCEITGLLAQIVYIDLVGLCPSDAERRFLAGIEFKMGEEQHEDVSVYSPTTANDVSPNEPKGQSIQGDNNIQAGRDVNFLEKKVTRNNVIREDGEITDKQAKKIGDLIKKVGDLHTKAGKTNEFGGLHTRLWSRYQCTSYKKIRSEDFEDAVSWLNQQAAMVRPKLRRSNNEVWRKEHYKGIYAAWGKTGRAKSEIYDFAKQRLELKKPISSLKDLGERNLKKLYDIVRGQAR